MTTDKEASMPEYQGVEVQFIVIDEASAIFERARARTREVIISLGVYTHAFGKATSTPSRVLAWIDLVWEQIEYENQVQLRRDRRTYGLAFIDEHGFRVDPARVTAVPDDDGYHYCLCAGDGTKSPCSCYPEAGRG